MAEAFKSFLFLALLLALVLGAGLVVVGGGDGAYSGEDRVKIMRRRQDVFEWLVEPKRRAQWKEGLVRSDQPEGEPRPGTVWREVYAVDGREEERTVEVLACDAEQGRFELRTTLAEVPVRVSYELGALHTGRRTLLHARFHAQWSGWWRRLWEPVLANGLRARFEAEHERLKQAVESSPF